MKNEIKAIITDLDGTILPKGGQISPETIISLKTCGSRNIVRIIATGRSLYATKKVLPPDIPIDFLVFSSGAGIVHWTKDELLFSKHLELHEAQDIARYLWDYNVNFTIQREIPDNHHFYYTDIYPQHEDYRHRIEIYKPFGTCINSPSEIQSRATQLIMILDKTQLRLLEQIRADLSEYSIVRSTSPVDNQAIWLEIFPKGINKGTICRQLLHSLDIPCEASAGVGNDYNDVDFLDICGQSFLVENAPVRLKPHYKSVASDRNNGFSEFISKVL